MALLSRRQRILLHLTPSVSFFFAFLARRRLWPTYHIPQHGFSPYIPHPSCTLLHGFPSSERNQPLPRPAQIEIDPALDGLVLPLSRLFRLEWCVLQIDVLYSCSAASDCLETRTRFNRRASCDGENSVELLDFLISCPCYSDGQSRAKESAAMSNLSHGIKHWRKSFPRIGLRLQSPALVAVCHLAVLLHPRARLSGTLG